MSDAVATRERFATLRLPSWAPPAWAFGVVWPILYLLLAVTVVALFYFWYQQGEIDAAIFTPLLLNLMIMATFQRVRDLWVALLFVFLAAFTLIWTLLALWYRLPDQRWLVVINIPYLVWILYALALQAWITFNN